MSHVARRRGPSLAGILVVLLFVGFALAGPVVIVWERLGAGTATGTAAAERAAAAAGGNTVGMAGLRFQPGTLTVAKGTRVVFDNDDTARTRSRPGRAGPTPGSSTRAGASAWWPPPASTTSAASIPA
jgi:hypothetical protein